MGIICQIVFHNNTHGVYYAGQTIAGQVTLSTDKVYQIKGIRLKVKGYAETHWTESKTDSNNKSSTETYRGFEKYFSSKVYLMGSSLSAEMSLEPGTRTFNFACHIPVNCPSSFEGTHGRIRYMVDVNIVQPWKYDSHFSRPFSVVQVMDLHTYESVSKIPVMAKTEKTFGVWPFRSDPLSLELTLPQNGFLPGQLVPLKVLVGNESNIRVHELKVSLAMMVTYHSDLSQRTKFERFSVTKMKSEGVLRNTRRLYEFPLLVPSTPPTCFSLCRIIKIAYQIEVVAKVKGMHINGTLTLPVTICGVPIPAQIPLQMSLPNPSAPQDPKESALVLLEGEAACAPAAPPYPWPEESSMAPPSYAEAMHFQPAPEKSQPKQVESEALEEKPYKPLYPVFNVPPITEEKKEEKSSLDKEEKK
ncbi:hypothetical protein KR018_011664 [Drosophila ironensis]|nr:hypothetical protein KR018_011664 [Drosophila ironensis]